MSAPATRKECTAKTHCASPFFFETCILRRRRDQVAIRQSFTRVNNDDSVPNAA